MRRGEEKDRPCVAPPPLPSVDTANLPPIIGKGGGGGVGTRLPRMASANPSPQPESGAVSSFACMALEAQLKSEMNGSTLIWSRSEIVPVSGRM